MQKVVKCVKSINDFGKKQRKRMKNSLVHTAESKAVIFRARVTAEKVIGIFEDGVVEGHDGISHLNQNGPQSDPVLFVFIDNKYFVVLKFRSFRVLFKDAGTGDVVGGHNLFVV